MTTASHLGPSHAVQDYVKAIHALAREHDGPVTTNALAAKARRQRSVGLGDAQEARRAGTRRARRVQGCGADRERIVVLLGTYEKDEYDPSMLQAQFAVLEAALCGEMRPANG